MRMTQREIDNAERDIELATDQLKCALVEANEELERLEDVESELKEAQETIKELRSELDHWENQQ